MRAAALALALLLPAGPALAAARSQEGGGCPEMSRYQGSWSGRQTCKSGRYSIAVNLERGREGFVARYGAGGGAQGQVVFKSGARPGTCEARAATPLGEVAFSVSFLDEGRRLVFRSRSLRVAGQDMPLPGGVSGSADLDKPLGLAQYRFTSALPTAEDACGGSLRRGTSR